MARIYHNIATLCNIVNMICFYRRFFFYSTEVFLYDNNPKIQINNQTTKVKTKDNKDCRQNQGKENCV